MKKKNVFVGIGCVIVLGIALSFNVSQSTQNSDISLLNIKAMTNAAAECTHNLEGYTCYMWASGIQDCLHVGEVGVYCKN